MHGKVWAGIAFGLRLVLGGLFLVAGAMKFGSPAVVAASVAGFRILPTMLIAPLATFLPFFEIGLGLYLIVGLFTRLVASLALAQLLVYSIAIVSVLLRGISTSCGCFGPGDDSPASWLDVLRDLLFAACTLPVISVAPGRLSVDWYLEKRG